MQETKFYQSALHTELLKPMLNEKLETFKKWIVRAQRKSPKSTFWQQALEFVLKKKAE